MLDVLIGITLVAAIGFAAFRAAEHVITLRRDKETSQQAYSYLKQDYDAANELIQSLQMQLKSVDQRTMADIDSDPFRHFRR